ncbi:MAG: Ferrous iron transport protein [Bacteroidota bacterium]|nr:Ferrous iron transport protein [Bacteroidota bacterium]
MTLIDATIEKTLRVSLIDSGEIAKRSLINLGIQVDDKLVKLNMGKRGPVLIKNMSNGAFKVAIGRGLADKIQVEYE